MKRTVSVVLLLCLVLGMLCGCSHTKKLEGTWTATADLSVLAAKALEGMESTVGQVEVSPFTVELLLVFDGEGYTATMDETSLNAAMDTLLGDVRRSVEALYKAQMGDMELTVDEYLALAGLSLDTVMAGLKKSLEAVDLSGQFAKVFAGSGTYEADGQLLALEGLLKCRYTLEGDTLTLLNPIVGMEEVVFTRQP